MNGGCPVISSNSTQPAAYTSLRASTASPRACSGDRYWAVPITAAVWVTAAWPSCTARAMPKSITLTAPVLVIITLAGFTSRWMMPCRWLKSSAAQTSAMTSMARLPDSGPCVLTMSRSVLPSTYSMTMYGSGPYSVLVSPVS